MEELGKSLRGGARLAGDSSIQQAGQNSCCFVVAPWGPGGGVRNMERQQGRVGSQVGALWNTAVSFRKRWGTTWPVLSGEVIRVITILSALTWALEAPFALLIRGWRGQEWKERNDPNRSLCLGSHPSLQLSSRRAGCSGAHTAQRL